jgi:5'(3')-deoxyribonucleotidase
MLRWRHVAHHTGVPRPAEHDDFWKKNARLDQCQRSDIVRLTTPFRGRLVVRLPIEVSVIAKILYIDMDNVLVDFPSGIARLSREVVEQYDDRLDEVPGIFSLMDPMPDAVESFRELSELYDTYILSTAPWENPSAWSDKLLWVKQHLGSKAHKRLILSHHKNLNDGHYLIDDRTKNGADRFKGEHIHFGTPQYPDWKSVVAYLRRGAT